MLPPKTQLRKIAGHLARKLGAIAALVLLGGLLSATLVRLAPGPIIARAPTINVRLLKDQTWRLLALDERIRAVEEERH